MTEAATIEEVIQRLTQIVNDSKAANARAGYFAALYREVTIAVKQSVDRGGYFDDDARMARFDVIFANRYLTAYDQMRAGTAPTQSWDFAFQVAVQWWPITLQHLLLGVNAHIALDLGIAAFETVGAQDLPALHNDFNKINQLLADLVGDVKTRLAMVYPPLRWLNRYLGDVEDTIINFSMRDARDSAWSFAQILAATDPGRRDDAIARRDAETLMVSKAIRYPGLPLEVITKAIRLGERGSVSEIIDILAAEGRNWATNFAERL